jgi:hypothetical protein
MKCQEPGCTVKRAYYNFKTETKGKYCRKHIKTDMINVDSPKCQNSECPMITATFNFPGEKKPIYCFTHKVPGMERCNRSCFCESPGCGIRATFNLPGEKKPIRCLKHILPKMVDVVSEKCSFEGCGRHPAFNMPGENKPLRCLEHIFPELFIHNRHNMINHIMPVLNLQTPLRMSGDHFVSLPSCLSTYYHVGNILVESFLTYAQQTNQQCFAPH